MHPFTLNEAEIKEVSGGDVEDGIWSCNNPIPPLDPGCVLTVGMMGEAGGPSDM